MVFDHLLKTNCFQYSYQSSVLYHLLSHSIIISTHDPKQMFISTKVRDSGVRLKKFEQFFYKQIHLNISRKYVEEIQHRHGYEKVAGT